ncbi:tenascin-X [Hyalangium rubrum]|uniref:Tenascin-X n=1 Tax=Hyalangium rubrum TaxID=3103134 RepID=A0ABU5HJU3_9BACT|nr:tenascin-X [Hyalangium sp. s54d21]MDY7233174.1 tenascin-X [Hyalangium sp. s54d21]
MWLLLLTGLMGVLGAACREERPPLVGVEGRLRLSQASVVFPRTYVGVSREETVRVSNGGRAPLEVSWTQVAAPFTVQGLPERVASSEVEVRVRFSPTEPGPYSATLTGTSSGGGTVALTLTGEGLAIPECPTPSACHGISFNVNAGRCVEQRLPDGTACDPGNECLLESTCVLGVCKGRERTCDDGNACTTDVCNPLDGCQTVPAPPCPGDGKCQQGVCDPLTGCGLAMAPDGTFCGERRGCDVADVCVEGTCVVRDLPDGFTCAPSTPCQREGRCQGPVCQRPSPTVLAPNWTRDTREELRELHDMMVWPDGSVTLSGFFEAPVLNATGETPVQSNQTGRRCMLWNERLLCMDMPRQGEVSLLEKTTGSPRWTFVLAQARPDMAAEATTIFMARLAVMAPDRLAALFEAYPAGSENSTLCRVYFLVVLNAKGALVSATKFTDPLLSQCNHPHPFGLVSDTRGNLYVAFSPTVNSGAPLMPGSPTLVLAYSPDGVELWRRTLPMAGGEFGAVNGLLLPERGTTALRMADGAEVGTLPVLGRAVATRERVVPSPEGTSLNPEGWGVVSPELRGYALPGLTPAWTYRLGEGESFVTKELRLADTKPRPGELPETLVVSFVAQGISPTLLGVRARDGSEAFRCELAYTPRTVPQLFELGPESLVMMDGAETCGECDPPFAYSSPRFQRFPLTGLQPSKASWPGTFGGPGHSHHETPVRAAP